MQPIFDYADLAYFRALMANVVFAGTPGKADWVLIDAGVATFGDNIAQAAAERFGASPPKAIVLTHGHFDHIGALDHLLKLWDVPVYAHERELPFLTGRADYPEPDATVGGGLLAAASPLYPNSGVDLGDRVRALPQGGSVPPLPEWRWVPTPGHTDGHVSLFRERDRALIAGDAFITVKQESAFSVLMQEKQIHGPPMYFTPDWEQAWASVKRLEALQPSVVITGHGVPMKGEELRAGLSLLAREFDKMAIPEHGRYVNQR